MIFQKSLNVVVLVKKRKNKKSKLYIPSSTYYVTQMNPALLLSLDRLGILQYPIIERIFFIFSLAKHYNISSVVEFHRWWVLKSKIFGQESTHLKEKKIKRFRRWMTVRQKLGMILEINYFQNRIYQKM